MCYVFALFHLQKKVGQESLKNPKDPKMMKSLSSSNQLILFSYLNFEEVTKSHSLSAELFFRHLMIQICIKEVKEYLRTTRIHIPLQFLFLQELSGLQRPLITSVISLMRDCSNEINEQRKPRSSSQWKRKDNISLKATKGTFFKNWMN